jgi:esterase/lipase superfamily enzyme
VVYPVWYGTNRKPAEQGSGFTGERGARTYYGRTEIFIPRSHRFGETGSRLWRRLLRGELRDDHLQVQTNFVQELSVFYDEINSTLEAARSGGRVPHALVFLHGFNVTFEEAAIRAAQIGYDLKVPGPVAFFSWPSRGGIKNYPADEATIEASEAPITDFLVEFAAKCGTNKVDIIAHSMGNRGLLRALQRISANAETRSQVKFNQIFLAAPDVDRALFLNLAGLYSQYSTRTTLYASDGDRPVYLSAELHRAPRAGYFKPYTVCSGVDTIAVPDFDIDLLGHSYFAQAEALMYDIRELILHDTPPTQRMRITPTSDSGMHFWQLGR